MNEDKKEPFSISDLTKKISAFLGIIIPVAGLYYNIKYYKAFNINITDFIDPGESLMMFCPKLSLICAIIGFCGFPTFLFLWYLRSKAKVVRRIGIAYLVLTVPILYFLYKHSAPTLVIQFAMYYVGMWIVMAIPIILLFINRFIKFVSHQMKVYAFIYLTTVSLSITLSTCELHSAVVQNLYRYKEVHVVLQEGQGQYDADTMNIYVGHTKHFLFLWSRMSRITCVYPIDKIKEFEFNQ